MERERRIVRGDSNIFNEVRVEFDFDPMTRRYRRAVCVRDESLLGRHNVYTLQSPFICTEQFADQTAAKLLSQLNSYRGSLRNSELERLLQPLAIVTGSHIALNGTLPQR